MKKMFKYAVMSITALAILFTGCKPKEQEDGEAYIISLTINNGGLSETERYSGTVNKDNKTVVFDNVAAETNLAAVTFEAKLSIGSKLDKKVYNFLETATDDATSFQQVLSVIPEFGEPVVYTITINTKPVETAPVIDRLVVKDADGAEHVLTMSDVIDGELLLGIEESATATAEVVEIALRPARATYEFTAINDNVISATNPGTLRLSFMGLTSEYQIKFTAAPPSGADFTKAKTYAWTLDGGNVYFDLADQNTRSGDMDENYILLVNRAGDAPNPYLLRIDDVLNSNVSNPITLDVTGVEGGTFAVSSGRITQGHIYVCNLQTPIGDEAPFIIYHWASPDATPEKVLEWTGELVNEENPFNLRLGDNMGLSLDAAGNGYAFFAGQETATERIIRFTVTGFTNFAEPTVITIKAAAQYYGNYNKVGENEYIYKATFNPVLWLYDKDATMLYELEFDGGADGGHATDFHIVEFNRGRYLVCTNARRYAYWKPEALLVYDITAGMTNAEALKIFDDNRPKDPDSEDPEYPDYLPFEPVFKYEYSSGESSVVAACSGICNAVVRGDKLVILSAAPTAGLVVVEVPMAQ